MQNEPVIKIDENGNKYWQLNGELHRDDGPAVEYSDGSKYWYLNGNSHRTDGPAVDYPDGYKEWYLNGKLHREDGPAIEYQEGDKSWYLNGHKYSFEEWLRQTPLSEQEKIKLRLKYAE